MNQLSQGGRSQAAPRQRPTSVDLILQARALRYRWFASALARLSARLARIVPEPGAATRPIRVRSERLQLSDRLAT